MADRDLVRKDRQTSNVSTPKGKNYLLAIAINDYQHCSKLNNAVYDVEAFVKLMVNRYNFAETNITYIKDSEASKKNIERVFYHLIEIISPQDNLVVYFSGHGRYHAHLGGFWVPVEAGNGDYDWSDYLPNDHIKGYLSRIKSFHTFLIADSCFSGSLFIEKSKERFSGDRRDTEPSRWALTSGKKEIVHDGQPGQHSPFAAALLDVFSKAEQPPGVMRICDLVLEKVAANAQQTPMGSPMQVVGHQGGQMVFYFKVDDEEREWQEAISSNSLESLFDFAEKYTNSPYLGRSYFEDAIEKIIENNIWKLVYNLDDIQAYKQYLKINAKLIHSKEALDSIERLEKKLIEIKRNDENEVNTKRVLFQEFQINENSLKGIISKLKKLSAKNFTSALSNLKTIVLDETIEDELLMLEHDYKHLEAASNKGLIDYEKSRQERMRLISALLTYISNLELEQIIPEKGLLFLKNIT